MNLTVVLLTVAFLMGNALNTNGQQQNKIKNIRLTALNSMERIGPQQQISGASQAIVKAAKNEVESFQVVVEALHQNAVIINAEMSDLTGKSGKIGKENASLFREEYTRVRLASPRTKLPPGLYPDPLIPFINPETGKPIERRTQIQENPDGSVISKGFEMYALPFEVWKGSREAIWVDIYIPKNTPAGEYKGALTVTVRSAKTGVIPGNDGKMFPGRTPENGSPQTVFSIDVIVHVWDFTLPDGPTHRNSFGGVAGAASAFGIETSSEAYSELELNYCKMLAENRINPPIPARLLPTVNKDGSLNITSERTSALKKYIEEFNVTDFPLYRSPIAESTTTNREKAIRYYREYYQYLKENGWDKRAYLYMVDEPNTKESYEEVLALGKLVHEAAPLLQCLVVEQTYKQDKSWPDIDPAVDIWCPLFSFIDRGTINEKITNGDEVWSYTALAQRAPGYSPTYNEVKDYDPPYWAIDQPLASYRMPTWINWQYKINGLLYWSTVYAPKSVTGVMDPWFLPVFSPAGHHFNGEGFLMYPGVPCGMNGPVASMRLKNIRDSMEDYEYFHILEQLAGREAVTRIVSTIVPNWWSDPDPKDFILVREKIANEILKLKKR